MVRYLNLRLHSRRKRQTKMINWFRNLYLAVSTVAQGLAVTIVTMMKTYNRRTFTEVYEYPETPVPVKPRYRGFHRFDLTTCIGCEKNCVIFRAR